ncbi:MAG: ROK family glucokinase [Armatimonadota bacterium]|nr:ROK family glucokinase [Armatimonadota bacterium]MDR7405034.1 ROK family glucokinase [Armatimonadota bacterium]
MYVIGVDLGGTKILTALVEPSGDVRARRRVATPQAGPEAVVEAIAATVEGVLADASLPRADCLGVGVGAPGPLDPQTGVVYEPANLPGWRDVPLAALLAARLGLPCHVENDANAAAVGEWWVGAGRGVADLVYITVSTGIGGGIILGHRLVQGCSGTAGEIGHTVVDLDGPVCGCGRRGHLEALASGRAIARMAAEAVAAGRPTSLAALGADPARLSAEVVAREAGRGDAVAREIFERAGFYVGVGVANLLNLLNPRRVVIGGGVSKAGALLLDPVRRTARQLAFERPARDAEIVPAALGDDAGVVGAAAVVLQRTGALGVPAAEG